MFIFPSVCWERWKGWTDAFQRMDDAPTDYGTAEKKVDFLFFLRGQEATANVTQKEERERKRKRLLPEWLVLD